MNSSSKKAFIISLLIHVSVFAAFVQYTPKEEEKKEVIILNMNMLNEVTEIKKELVQKNEVTTKEQKKQIEEKKVQKVEKKVEPIKKEIKPVKKPEPKKKIVKKEPKKEVKKQPLKEVKKEPVLEKVTPQKKQEESKKRVKSGENYQQKYIKTNLDSIIAAIKKYKTYPYAAKKQGYEGKVVVSCLINSRGEIKEIKIVKECKYNILNQNSIKILKLASKEFEPPEKDVRLTIPFNYYLH